MKKRKLQAEFDFNFLLLGMITASREYKLAWELNALLEIELNKASDIHLEFIKGPSLIISNYLFETEHSCIRLLKNRSVDELETNAAFLIPELKRFDFLIMVRGFQDTFSDSELKAKLGSVSGVQYVQQFELEKLKSKENLIF